MNNTILTRVSRVLETVMTVAYVWENEEVGDGGVDVVLVELGAGCHGHGAHSAGHRVAGHHERHGDVDRLHRAQHRPGTGVRRMSGNR